MLWGCELNKKQTWTFKPQKEAKQNCELLLSMTCLGENAKEEMNVMGILPPASPEDKNMKPITMTPLQASVPSMVIIMGCEFSPPVAFQLQGGSGPVFLSGQECQNISDLSQEQEEEKEEKEDDVDVDAFLEEEAPVQQVKKLVPQKQTSIARKRRSGKSREAVRFSHKDNSPVRKVKPTLRPKKPGSKK